MKVQSPYQSLPGLLAGFTRILHGCHDLLRPGGIAVVTARPWREYGGLIDLPSAVIAAGVTAGFRPLERCVALLAAVRDGHLVARPSFFQLQQVRNARARGIPMHLIAHEDVLIMIKEPTCVSSAEPKCSQRKLKYSTAELSHVDTRAHDESGGAA